MQAHLLRQSGWGVYRLPHAASPDEVTKLAIGADGQLWVGTRWGLYLFDSERWEPYLTSPNGRTYVYVTGLAVDNENRVWATSYSGLQVITDRQVQILDTYPLSSPAMATDERGQVWIGDSLNHGIAPVTTQGIGESLPGTNPNLNPERANTRVIAFGPDGRMWIGTAEGVSAYDGTQWRDYTPVPHMSVTDIAFDPQGRAWVAGCTYGLPYCFESGCLLASFDSPQWTRYPISDPGRNDEVITALAFDAQGRLWVKFDQINGLDFGLGMYDGEKWVFYETADVIDPLSGDTNSGSALVIEDRGRLWMGVGPTLVAFDIQSNLPVPDPVPDVVFERRKISHYVAWGSGALTAVFATIATWALVLRSRWGQAWTQRLQTRAAATTMYTKKSWRSWLMLVLCGLICGMSLISWTILCFLLWQGNASNLTEPSGKPDLQQMVMILGLAGPVFFAFGIGTGFLLYSGGLGIRRGHTPTQLALGILGILVSILLWLGAAYVIFIFIGLIATG